MSNKMHVNLTVNGEDHEFLAEPRELLIYALREKLNITGPHVGCETSHCGACTVTMNGKSVKSCTVFVAQANGAEVTTIEGITAPVSDVLHPVQQAWLEIQVPQCGYCQSGQIMSAVALLNENENPDDNQIKAAMKGNICRCGTYPRIKTGIKKAIQLMQANTNSPKDA